MTCTVAGKSAKSPNARFASPQGHGTARILSKSAISKPAMIYAFFEAGGQRTPTRETSEDPPDFRRSVVAILRRFSDLHPKASKMWNTAKSHASSEQKATADPCLSWQGHPTIAHRFSGGTSDSLAATAPTGATETRTRWPRSPGHATTAFADICRP